MMNVKNILSIIIIMAVFASTAGADKVWLDENLIYDTDHISIIDLLKLRKLAVPTTVFTGIAVGAFGGGGIDCGEPNANPCWTQADYQADFPTFWNQYSTKKEYGGKMFYVSFWRATGGTTGQYAATSEKALFDRLDASGVDYSSFYTRPTPTPTPTGTVPEECNNLFGDGRILINGACVKVLPIPSFEVYFAIIGFLGAIFLLRRQHTK